MDAVGAGDEAVRRLGAENGAFIDARLSRERNDLLPRRTHYGSGAKAESVVIFMMPTSG